MEPCKVCGCNIYEEKDGYMFCTSCCTQSQNYVDMEVEEGYQHLNKTVIKDTKEIEELTTWEEYNYVLVGLVNQLIDLGAKDEVKLVTLQLWTDYLRKSEVAFFSKTEHELPRLPLAYTKKDAIIMYDKKKGQKKASKRKISYHAKAHRKRQRKIIESEYNEIISKSSKGSSSNQSIPINFTRNARKILKKIMPKKHIKVHSESDSRPKCHKILRADVPYKNKVQHMGARILISLMYIALNKVNDQIQLGDMLRWFREGHLSIMDIARFFPDNYKISRRLAEQMGQAALMSHYRLRLNTLIVLQCLNIQNLDRPDITELCRRYVNELGLPDTISKYTERLIRLYPPVMERTQSFNTEIVPNYEGRAMAYIIFVLKLIFGLNGTTEELLSDSAEKFNSKISEMKLFNYRKWMQCIELRKLIISEHHFPTKLSADPNSHNNSHLYINHLNSIQTDSDKTPINPSKVIHPLFKAMLKVAEIHSVNDDKKIKQNLIKFRSSLTPNTDYIAHLIKTCEIDFPKSIFHDYRHDEIDVYLKKNYSRRYVREKFKIIINFREIPNKMINMNKNLSKHTVHRGSEDILRKYNGTSGRIEIVDKQIPKRKSIDRLIENEIKIALSRLSTGSRDEEQTLKTKEILVEHAKILVNENNSSFGYEPVQPNLDTPDMEQLDKDHYDFESEPEYVFENDRETYDGLQPNRNLESKLRIFDNQSEDELSDDVNAEWTDNDIDLYVPNFNYWRRVCHTGKNFGQNYYQIERELPKSFNWLLRECARIIENKPHELYTELLTVEAGFICFIKPLTRETTRVKFRTSKKFDKFSTNYMYYIEHLRQHW